MERKYTRREKLRYWFDNTLNRGTIAIIAWLAVLSCVLIIVAGAILALFGISQTDRPEIGFIEAVWESLMRTLDAGTMGADEGWAFRIVALFVTLGGIFIVSTFIGTLTSGIESKLEEMRKGRSQVLESGHTLILGWSSKIFTIISEIMVANKNLRNQHIVIMADRDKIEMEDEINDKIEKNSSTSIICRTGNPLDLYDLGIVSPHDAKSIIVLSNIGVYHDINTIKTIMALTSNPQRKAEPYHIVAEIQDEENMEAVQMVGKNEAIVLQTSDILARLTAQTCRQPGLSIVYNELLDFDGVEIYIKSEPALTGKKFRDMLFMYDDSAIIGIMSGDGTILINPPMDLILKSDDQIIVFAEDDNKIVLSGKTTVTTDESSMSQPTKHLQVAEKKLILGWNERTPTLLRELDKYLATGSEVRIIARYDNLSSEVNELQKQMKNSRLLLQEGNHADRKMLETVNLGDFRDIIVVGYDNIDIQIADAKTLLSLLHIRNLAEKAKVNPNIVSEMFDVRNRDLAEVAEADDFIISERIISLMISQLSENKHLEKVFNILFSSEGAGIYINPASDYIKSGQTVDFYTVVESAARWNEIAIGYRLEKHAHESARGYGVVINPDKTVNLTFTTDDKIIVVSTSK